MTRECFNDFIHSAEHSASLRRKLRKCSNPRELIKLAKDYGFSVSESDLKEDPEYARIEEWFKTSKIPPIRN